jgi:hypothetical protein
MIHGLDKDIEHASLIALRRVGLMAEREIVKLITSQPSNWPELNEDYKAWKEKKGFSTSMLIRSSDMINRITTYNYGSTILVGLAKHVINRDGDDLADIAATMEYGSEKRGIPPRPFLLPSKDKVIKHLKETGYFGNFVLNYIKKKNGIL